MKRSLSYLFLAAILASAAAGTPDQRMRIRRRGSLAASVDPVSASRLPFGNTWAGKVGVEGGIPSSSWTQCGATIEPYGSAGSPGAVSTINTAIAGCSANTYVLLNSGTFFVDGAVVIAKSNVELRGTNNANGLPATTIDIRGGSSELIRIQGASWDLSTTGQFTRRSVTSGVTRGSTAVVVSSTPTSLVAGMLMFLSCTGVVGDDDHFYSMYTTDPFIFISRVTNVSGTTVTFKDPINADYLTSTNCQIGYRTAAGVTIRNSGIRNISFVKGGAASGSYFRFSGTDECWLVNVKTFSVTSNAYHVYLYGTYRTEIRHSDFAHMESLGSSTYAIFAQMSTAALIEDNYFHDMPNVMPFQGFSGSAFVFNYITDLPYASPGFLSQIVFHHGGHNHFNLFEGNWLATGYHDTGGSSINQLWFRNRMRGYDATGPKDSNTKSLTMEGGGDLTGFTYAGNVLGEDGGSFHTTYSTTFSTVEHTSPWFIYALHTDVVDFQKIGNYNTVTDGVHASEALGAGQALVDSYLYSSKPSWWGTSQPWPWVSPTNFTQSNTVTNFPAGHRAVNGTDPN